MENLVYSSVYVGEGNLLRLKVIRSTGKVKKKYISTDMEIDLFEFENIEGIVEQIQNKVSIIIKTKEKYDWSFYNISDMKYLTNVIIFENDIKNIIFTNINETSIIDILKTLYNDALNKLSFINLNGINQHAILIDPYIYRSPKDNYAVIRADLYSENGNMEGSITLEYNYDAEYLTTKTMKVLIDDAIINASQRLLIECKKKDIAVVSNRSYLLEL